jgi:hypothetical protein
VALVSIAEYLAQIGAPNVLQFPERNVRQELEALTAELKDVESQLTAIKSTIYGLALIYGPQIASPEVLESARPEARKHKRGLTEACYSVLQYAPGPCSVSEVCAAVNETSPELLLNHRSPMASVMSVLRNMERRRLVVRGFHEGRSVWQLARSPLERLEDAPARARECFQ